MTLLSKRLHTLMLEHSKSQKDLAFSTNIERSTLTKILNGTTVSPKIETIKALAKYFNVDIEYLLNDKDDERTIHNGNPVSLNLKELIKAHGLTSLALHNHTGVPESVISEIITGTTQNPTLKTLQVLSEFFNVTITQLMGKAPFNASETNLNYNLITIPFILYENLDKWINSNFVDTDKYVKVNRKILGNKAYAIKFSNNKFSPDIQLNEVIVVDPNIKLQLNDIFISKDTNFLVYEYIKISDNLIVLRELGTNKLIKIPQDQLINYGVVIQKYFDK